MFEFYLHGNSEEGGGGAEMEAEGEGGGGVWSGARCTESKNHV